MLAIEVLGDFVFIEDNSSQFVYPGTRKTVHCSGETCVLCLEFLYLIDNYLFDKFIL